MKAVKGKCEPCKTLHTLPTSSNVTVLLSTVSLVRPSLKSLVASGSYCGDFKP